VRYSRLLTGLALLALVALSCYERTRALNASYWIDEGISVGIASHPLADIPGLMRQDGSPPLYYMLLHVWTELFGTRETVTHQLSLGFALLCIPAAYWAASAWGRLAGLAAAALAAFSPFLDVHAVETRMYTLVVLLGLLATGAYVRGFVGRERRHVVVFALLLAVMLYSHNWALFFAVGAGAGIAGLALVRRDAGVLRDGALAAGGTLLLYLPWVPTLLDQAEHTGAPWSTTPTARSLEEIPHALFGTDRAIWFLLLAAAVGFAVVVWRRRDEEREAGRALALTIAVSVGLAYGFAQLEPGWASRYFAVFLPPAILLLALGAARARVVGAAAVVAFAWISYNPVTPSPYFKSNAEAVANEVNRSLRPGDVVLSTQPEQVPLLRHYLVSGLVYADPLGPVPDNAITDWRDITERLREAVPPASIEPVLRRVRPGARLALVRPIVRGSFGWRAPWTRLVRQRSEEVAAALDRDRRFRAIGTYSGTTRVRSRRVGVLAVLYRRV
jgi:mannosyltransferase